MSDLNIPHEPSAVELPGWEGNILNLVHRLSSGVGRVFDRRLRQEHGVSVPEWRILMQLAERPGTTAVDIAAIYAMDKMAVTRAIQRLMRTGAVERHRRANDRRSYALHLTPAGAELYRALLPGANARYRELVDVLSSDEHRQLGDLLERLAHRLGELKD